MTDERVKIIFQLKRDEHGFPPEEREGIWACPLMNGNYQLDNVPFFALGVSDGDEVSATQCGSELVFNELVQPSNNCTVRIMFLDRGSETGVRSKLQSMGCSIKGTGIEGLISVSVDKDSYAKVSDFLSDQFALNNLDFQEASLR